MMLARALLQAVWGSRVLPIVRVLTFLPRVFEVGPCSTTHELSVAFMPLRFLG
jgi:hypothetical protein